LIHLTSPESYVQVGVVCAALVLAWLIVGRMTSRVQVFREELKPGALFDLRTTIYSFRKFLLPAVAALALGIATLSTAE